LPGRARTPKGRHRERISRWRDKIKPVRGHGPGEQRETSGHGSSTPWASRYMSCTCGRGPGGLTDGGNWNIEVSAKAAGDAGPTGGETHLVGAGHMRGQEFHRTRRAGPARPWPAAKPQTRSRNGRGLGVSVRDAAVVTGIPGAPAGCHRRAELLPDESGTGPGHQPGRAPGQCGPALAWYGGRDHLLVPEPENNACGGRGPAGGGKNGLPDPAAAPPLVPRVVRLPVLRKKDPAVVFVFCCGGEPGHADSGPRGRAR